MNSTKLYTIFAVIASVATIWTWGSEYGLKTAISAMFLYGVAFSSASIKESKRHSQEVRHTDNLMLIEKLLKASQELKNDADESAEANRNEE